MAQAVDTTALQQAVRTNPRVQAAVRAYKEYFYSNGVSPDPSRAPSRDAHARQLQQQVLTALREAGLQVPGGYSVDPSSGDVRRTDHWMDWAGPVMIASLATAGLAIPAIAGGGAATGGAMAGGVAGTAGGTATTGGALASAPLVGGNVGTLAVPAANATLGTGAATAPLAGASVLDRIIDYGKDKGNQAVDNVVNNATGGNSGGGGGVGLRELLALIGGIVGGRLLPNQNSEQRQLQQLAISRIQDQTPLAQATNRGIYSMLPADARNSFLDPNYPLPPPGPDGFYHSPSSERDEGGMPTWLKILLGGGAGLEAVRHFTDRNPYADIWNVIRGRGADPPPDRPTPNPNQIMGQDQYDQIMAQIEAMRQSAADSRPEPEPQAPPASPPPFDMEGHTWREGPAFEPETLSGGPNTDPRQRRIIENEDWLDSLNIRRR